MSTQQTARRMHGCCADKVCNDKNCMALPEGTTCGDCANFYHCAAFYARTHADTSCDFFPRRFLARATTQQDQA